MDIEHSLTRVLTATVWRENNRQACKAQCELWDTSYNLTSSRQAISTIDLETPCYCCKGR